MGTGNRNWRRPCPRRSVAVPLSHQYAPFNSITYMKCSVIRKGKRRIASGLVKKAADATCRLQKRRLDLLLQLRRHANCRRRDADGGDDRLGLSPQCGTKANSAANRFFAIHGNPGAARFFKFGEELMAIDNGVFGARGQAVDLENAVRLMAVLEGGNDFTHGAAVGRQYTADFVGHPYLVKGLNAVEHVDTIVEEVGRADCFIEAP